MSSPAAPAQGDPPGLDLARLRAFLDRERPGLLSGDLRGELVAGGRSNLTYVVGDGRTEVVVRRPPLGHVLATAHDMAREHRVITALAGSAVPVPRTYLLCEDESVIGAPFYVMERVEGQVLRTAEQTDRLDAEQKRRLADSLVDVLVALHAVDPGAVGLADFGRPEGYLARQVKRWGQQLDASRSRAVDGIDELRAALATAVPESQRASIVHGDYRLDNVIVGDDLRIRAVLDWEMATLGDPLADVGLLLVYWDGLSRLDNPIAASTGAPAGFPPGTQLVARYAERSGLDLSRLGWYVALGYFKLAVVLEGIHYRYTQGKTVGAGFDRIGDVVAPLAAAGLATLREG
jgi:aminoglycoside phosphotransferase (APT) family kinase protein